jgi:hypothetical protein
MPTTTGDTPPHATQPVEVDTETGKEILAYNLSGALFYDNSVGCEDFLLGPINGVSLATRLLLHHTAQGLPHSPSFADYAVSRVHCQSTRRSLVISVDWNVVVSTDTVSPDVLWALGLPAVAESVRTRLAGHLATGVTLPAQALVQAFGNTSSNPTIQGGAVAVAHVEAPCSIGGFRDFCASHIGALPQSCLDAGCTVDALQRHDQWVWRAPTAAPTPGGFIGEQNAPPPPPGSQPNLHYSVEGGFVVEDVPCSAAQGVKDALRLALAITYHSKTLPMSVDDVHDLVVSCGSNNTLNVTYDIAVPATRTDQIVADSQHTVNPLSRIQILNDFRHRGTANDAVLQAVLRDQTQSTVQIVDHLNTWPRYVYKGSDKDMEIDKVGAFFIVISACVFFVGGAFSIACFISHYRHAGYQVIPPGS